MPTEITMPRLSDTMERGTVVKWNVKEGDAVKSGDVLAEIETDKATMELESFDTGTVAALLVGEGESVSVGAAIVVLASKDEDVAEVKKSAKGGAKSSGGDDLKKSKAAASADANGDESEQPANGRAPVAVADEPDDDSTDARDDGEAPERGGSDRARDSSDDETGGRIFASPLARKMAEDMGIDLRRISGSGPSGRIVKADVEAAAAGKTTRRAESRAAAPEPDESRGEPVARPWTSPEPPRATFGKGLEKKKVALSNMRRTIARRLVESKTSIPHYQVTVAVDMDPLLRLRAQLNDQLKAQGVKLSVNDFLVRACAIAMHMHPHVNSSWDESKKGEPVIRLLDRVNVGVAISIPLERGGGLVVATIRDADRVGLREISARTGALAQKARTKGLTIEEQSDATFTISNLGMFGVEHFTAIINPPNVAILAVGAATKKPVVREVDGEDQIVIGHEMQMTMSSDHRVVDGAMAAEYLSTVRELIEKPANLLV